MLTTSVERLEGSKAKLTVTVAAEEVDRYVDRAYKELGKKYRIPGFRPGKAPRPIIDQQLGKGNILADATENMVNESYSKAVDQEGLRPIESPELEELDIVTPGEDYTFVADIELRPEFTLLDYNTFEVKLPQREVTQAELDHDLESARERFANLEPVEDRGVEANDFVLVSFVGTVAGEAYEGNTVDKYLYEMNRGLMPPEFDAGLIGAKPGDERHVEFTIPDTSSNEEFVGKTAAFDITVHEIKAKVLPELDDAFASNYGFDSAEQLVNDLKGRLQVQKDSAFNRLLEDRIRAELALRLEGEIPEAMITTRQGQMMRDFITMLEQREMTVDAYLEGTGLTMDQVEADMKKQAETSLREELALEAFSRGTGIEITEEDIDKEISILGTTSGMDPAEARERWESLGLMPVMHEQILQSKAMNWLLENVTITEVADDEQNADEASEAGTKKKPAKRTAKKKKDEAETAEAAEAAETEE